MLGSPGQFYCSTTRRIPALALLMCERREGLLGHRVRKRALDGEAPDAVDLRELSAGAVVVELAQSLEVDPSVDQSAATSCRQTTFACGRPIPSSVWASMPSSS